MILHKTFYEPNQIIVTSNHEFLYTMEYRITREETKEESWVVYNSITKQISTKWLKVPHAS